LRVLDLRARGACCPAATARLLALDILFINLGCPDYIHRLSRERIIKKSYHLTKYENSLVCDRPTNMIEDAATVRDLIDRTSAARRLNGIRP
jgi:hypothetical protein